MYKLQVHGASADVPYTGFGSSPRAIDSYKTMARWIRACLGTYKPEEDGPTELPRSVQQQGQSKMVQILFKVFLVGLVLACLGQSATSRVPDSSRSCVFQLVVRWACMARVKALPQHSKLVKVSLSFFRQPLFAYGMYVSFGFWLQSECVNVLSN